MNFGECGGKPPKILKCSCSHDHQDTTYGKGMRLCNRIKPKEKYEAYRCTVCKKEHAL